MKKVFFFEKLFSDPLPETLATWQAKRPMLYVGHGLSSVVFRDEATALKVTPGCSHTDEHTLLKIVQGCSPFVVQIRDVPEIDLNSLLAATPVRVVRATENWKYFDVVEGDIISDDEDNSMFPQEWVGDTFRKHSYSVLAMECLPDMSLQQYLLSASASEVIHCCAQVFCFLHDLQARDPLCRHNDLHCENINVCSKPVQWRGPDNSLLRSAVCVKVFDFEMAYIPGSQNLRLQEFDTGPSDIPCPQYDIFCFADDLAQSLVGLSADFDPLRAFLESLIPERLSTKHLGFTSKLMSDKFDFVGQKKFAILRQEVCKSLGVRFNQITPWKCLQHSIFSEVFKT